MQLNANNFALRIEKLINHMQQFRIPALQMKSNSKGSSEEIENTNLFFTFIYENPMQDTTMIMTNKSILIIASEKKINFLKSIIEESSLRDLADITLEVSESSTSDMKFIEEFIEKNYLHSVQTVLEDLKKINPDLTKIVKCEDLEPTIGHQFSLKDEMQLSYIKKCNKFTNQFQSSIVIPQIEELSDDKEGKTCNEISERFETILNEENNEWMNEVISETKVDMGQLESSFTPFICSGKECTSRIVAKCTDTKLTFDVIRITLSQSQMDQYSQMTRVLLINPTQSKKDNYTKLASLMRNVSDFLTAGRLLKEVYNDINGLWDELFPESSCPKNLGFGIGLRLKEKHLEINSSNEEMVYIGHSYMINFTVLNLHDEHGEQMLQLANNFIIGKDGKAECLNTSAGQEFEDIFQKIGDDDLDIEDMALGVVGSRRKRENVKNQRHNEKVRKHQEDLRKNLTNEIKQRQDNGELHIGDQVNKITVLKHELISVKGKVMRELNGTNYLLVHSKDVNFTYQHKIQIPDDKNNNSVQFKIRNIYFPIHIACIKSVKSNELVGNENDVKLTISFEIPDQKQFKSKYTLLPKPLDIDNENPSIPIHKIISKVEQVLERAEGLSIEKKLKDKIKEFVNIFNKPKEQFTNEDQEVVKSNFNEKICNIKVKFNNKLMKQASYSLLCHQNCLEIKCLQYSVQLMQENIKNFILQISDNETHLMIQIKFFKKYNVTFKNNFQIDGIIISKNKFDEKNMEADIYDEEVEMMNEKQQRKDIKNMQKEFYNFAKKVESIIGCSYDEVSETNFYGILNSDNLLFHLSENCILSLSEVEFCLDLSDIELAVFERVSKIKKSSFDLNLIHKDYCTITSITCIPNTKFLDIREFVDNKNVVYAELSGTQNWATMLKDIRSDISQFLADGGWDQVHTLESKENHNASSAESDGSSDGFQTQESSEDEDVVSSDAFKEESAGEEDDYESSQSQKKGRGGKGKNVKNNKRKSQSKGKAKGRSSKISVI